MMQSPAFYLRYGSITKQYFYMRLNERHLTADFGTIVTQV